MSNIIVDILLPGEEDTSPLVVVAVPRIGEKVFFCGAIHVVTEVIHSDRRVVLHVERQTK